MTPPIPSTEPDVLYAGDTAKWTKTFSDYPSTDGWTLAYAFRGPTAVGNATIAQSGTGFAVTLDASVTATLTAGTYQWTARVTKGSETYSVARGVLVVEVVAGGVAVSHEAKTLALIEAAIEGRVPAGMQAFTIGGRQVQQIPIEELVRLRGIYQAKVYRLANPGRLGIPVSVEFPPSAGVYGGPSPVVLPPWYRVGG